jgi:small-conductance mechanosensitive channel
MTSILSIAGQVLVTTPLVFVTAAVIALVVTEIFFHFLRRVGRRWAERSFSIAIARRCWWPARLVAVVTACELVLPLAGLSDLTNNVVLHLLMLLMIGGSAWLIVALSFAVEDAASARFRIDVQDNLRARRVRTRINVVRRLTLVLVTGVALGAMLTTFDSVRSFGTGLLASAGIAGLVVGIAARPTISNVIAGLQIFFAEPLRIDDVVVIEHEWGRVEEITLTYVVVRTWDERTLVLPLTYFLEHPFENWTRRSSHLLAAVHVAVDFNTPVQRVREELRRILETSALWDRRTWNLQVTDVGKDSAELRALMTARDATTAWDLRCEVREALLLFLQRSLPAALPRHRVNVVENGKEAYAHGTGAG